MRASSASTAIAYLEIADEPRSVGQQRVRGGKRMGRYLRMSAIAPRHRAPPASRIASRAVGAAASAVEGGRMSKYVIKVEITIARHFSRAQPGRLQSS